MEVGDCFRHVSAGLSFIYRVVKILSRTEIACEVLCNDREVGFSHEHRNTLLKMQKLTPLEKELM
jgi:hypothetical protein